MTAITFDTLKFSEKLTKAGFSPEQAKAIIETEQEAFQETMDNTLATKDDIRSLKEATKQDIQNLKSEIDKDIQFLRDDINELKQKIYVHDWMLRFILVFQVAILLKLFLA